MSINIDNWDAPIAPFQEDAWTKVLCGCPGCLETNSYYDKNDSRNHLTKYTCRKMKEYSDTAILRDHYRAINHDKPKAFKPASKMQTENWVTWLSSDGAIQAQRRLNEEKEKYKMYKFNAKEMERELSRCWPAERMALLNSVRWNSYEFYKNEQNRLLKSYNKTEESYKLIIDHIFVHGQLIDELPVFENKKFDQSSNLPKKMGRRAARHAREEETPTEKSYTRAELRHMVRASEQKAEESSSEEE
jgi:hypothetical protein